MGAGGFTADDLLEIPGRPMKWCGHKKKSIITI